MTEEEKNDLVTIVNEKASALGESCPITIRSLVNKLATEEKPVYGKKEQVTSTDA